jgi:2-oxoglutarate dehydrogenase E2 component (dihydrolipoamide succinyltransferase)
MAVELIVPSVGESITEVEIGDWLKSEGELVARDEPVVVVESDKVSVELPAPTAGRITAVLKHKGEKAAVGDVIGYMEPDGAAPASSAAPQPSAPSIEKVEEKETAPAPPAASAAPESGIRIPEPAAAPSSGRKEEVVPMSPIRRRIAERLVEAQKNAALLTTFNQADMSAVLELRKTHQESFRERFGVKLGLMSFFVKASVEALKLVPQLNAEIRGQDIVFRNYYDIAIAISGGKGLAAPVLRNAERMSFAEIETKIADFASRARENKLTLDELQGGTFTISNGGIFGSMLSTPIVNPPQSGVLGMHAIEERPVARAGAVVIRPMMYLALGYDHRIVDGREAVTFLKRIRDIIEDPVRMLLEI